MRFYTILTSLLSISVAATAAADGEEPAVAPSVLQNLKHGFEALAAAANQFTGDPHGLTSAAESLLTTLEADVERLKNAENLKAKDCFPLVKPSLAVEKHGNILASVLKARRPEIELHQLCGAVQQFLSRGVDDSAEFAEVLKSKVPGLIKPVVKLSGDMTIKTLKQLRDYFHDDVCFDEAQKREQCLKTSPLTVSMHGECFD